MGFWAGDWARQLAFSEDRADTAIMYLVLGEGVNRGMAVWTGFLARAAKRLVELERGAQGRGHLEETCRGVWSMGRERGTGGGLGAGVSAEASVWVGARTGVGTRRGTGAAFLGRQLVRQNGDSILMVLVLNPNVMLWSVSQGIPRITWCPPNWVT